MWPANLRVVSSTLSLIARVLTRVLLHVFSRYIISLDIRQLHVRLIQVGQSSVTETSINARAALDSTDIDNKIENGRTEACKLQH